MPFSPIPVWKEAPFLRLLIPFAAGILLQRYFQWTYWLGCTGLSISIIGLLLFAFKNINTQFRKYWIYGLFLNAKIFFAGVTLTFLKTGSNNTNCITRFYTDTAIVVVKLGEPPAQKAKSLKALASLQAIQIKDSLLPVKGNIIIYFQKDRVMPQLSYGTQIVIKKKLQPVKNTGNPGSFDYRQYCLFQEIYYQIYLKPGEYQILQTKKINPFKQFLFDTRRSIITILRNNIPGDKESGLAEALLIGYKDDLDKNLVQSYSNTGVIHIIAISGLHVGLIYWLLTRLSNLLTKRKTIFWFKPVLVIAGLWIFSFLAGGSPSVLRSAVMFTFIVVGESISRKISVYNSLAASGFLLLAYNPFWLWDVGFQLSYAAVLSIVIFMKPIYNWCFIQNKILYGIWKLNAVTLAAQVLTIPICLYYFHRFPNFFLITNLIAVPLSGIILLGELFLCLGFFLPALAKTIGWILYLLIRLMNIVIQRIDSLPFAVLENIQISTSQLFSLYIVIVSLSIWLLKIKRQAFICALLGAFLFGIERTHSRLITSNQRKLIVYNIPFYQSIDFIEGNNYFFRGDGHLLKDDFLQNFHLKPSRIAQRITEGDSLPNLFNSDCYFLFLSKKIMIIEKALPKIFREKKVKMDIIIISKNPKVSMEDIYSIFSCKQIIFDASNTLWNISKWKTGCDQLNIPYYSVPEKGAFVMNMN